MFASASRITMGWAILKIVCMGLAVNWVSFVWDWRSTGSSLRFHSYELSKTPCDVTWRLSKTPCDVTYRRRTALPRIVAPRF